MNRRPEMISPLFFIPLSPSNLRPFGAPPSIGRRECPREPLPLEGAAERSEAGLASFLGGAWVLSYNGALETIFFALFHTARTLSGSLRSPPSPRGEGFVSGIPLSPSNLRPFGAPPSRGRRECPREPLPLEGARGAASRGWLPFWAAKPPPLCLPHAWKALLGKRYSRFFIHPTQKRPSLTSGRFYVYYLLRETPLPSSSPYRRRSKGSGRGSGHTL